MFQILPPAPGKTRKKTANARRVTENPPTPTTNPLDGRVVLRTAFFDGERERTSLDNQSLKLNLYDLTLVVSVLIVVVLPLLSSTMNQSDPEASIRAAYSDAKARGLPDCWRCTIDVSELGWVSRRTVLLPAVSVVVILCGGRIHLTGFLLLSINTETEPPQMDSSDGAFL